MANNNPTTNKVFEALEPVVADAGCELLEVLFLTENKRKILRLIIDKVGLVDMDDCSRVSLAAEQILDTMDYIATSYDLEVSSPGFDRPIITDSDFRRNAGRLLDINVKSMIDGRDHFEGYVGSFDSDTIVLLLDEPSIKGKKPKSNGSLVNISRNNIKAVTRAIRF